MLRDRSSNQRSMLQQSCIEKQEEARPCNAPIDAPSRHFVSAMKIVFNGPQNLPAPMCAVIREVFYSNPASKNKNKPVRVMRL